MKAKKSPPHGNAILFIAIGTFGLIALTSHFYLQNPELVWNLSYLSASLDSANEETEKIPETQLRQLQFPAIPLDQKAIDNQQIKLSGVFTYQSPLSNEQIIHGRNALLKQTISKYTTKDHLTAYLEKFSIIEEKTDLDEKNQTVALNSTLNVSLIQIPWKEVYEFIKKESLLDKNDLKQQGYQVSDFQAYYQEEKLFARLTLVAPPSEKSELLLAE